MDFRQIIRKVVSIFASAEFAFVYCVVGTLAQTSHTYYLVDSISSLTGWSKALQGYALSFFISSSLLFFTAIADESDDSKGGKRVLLAVNLFMFIEILINIYYYGSYLVLKQEEPRIYDFIFALLISCMIPVTIKLYAGVIRAKEWLEDVKVQKEVEESEKLEALVTPSLPAYKDVLLDSDSHTVTEQSDINDVEDKVVSEETEEVDDSTPTQTPYKMYRPQIIKLKQE